MLLVYSYIFVSALGVLNVLSRKSNWLLLITFIFLTILIGFRNMGGSDFILYENQYIQQFDAERWERGYIWISSFFSALNFSYQGFILSISAICLGVLHYSIKKYSPWVMFSVVLYMSLYLIYYNAIALRQMFALTLAVFSFQFIEQRKLLLFVLTIFLSFWFHKSSIVFAIAYPFCVYYKFNPITFIPILLSSFLLSFFDFSFLTSLLSDGSAQDLMQERFADYTNSERATSITSILKIGVVLFFILIRYKEMEQKPYFDVFVKLYFLFICLFLAFNKWSIMMRLYSYFEISFIFIVPMVLYNMQFKSIINKILIYLFVVVFFGAAYVSTILHFDNGDLLLYGLEFEGF